MRSTFDGEAHASSLDFTEIEAGGAKEQEESAVQKF